MKTLRNELIAKLKNLQHVTASCPYSIAHRLKLAEGYRRLGYPDLAAGDAYKALLLIDEVVEQGEYAEEATEAAKGDLALEALSSLAIEPEEKSVADQEDAFLNLVRAQWSKPAYNLLISSLLDCGCFRSASDYISRAQRSFPGDLTLEKHAATLSDRLRSHFDAAGTTVEEVTIDDYPDRGLVRRENYPWNEHEPDRFSKTCLEFLNEEMAKVAPKLEVKAVELPMLTAGLPRQHSDSETLLVKQLGVFAKENVEPGEQILEEKSLLTAVFRLHDAYCDACSAKLPNARELDLSSEQNSTITCEECNEVYFCSDDCHDEAQTSYHPALCGVSIDQGSVPAREAADSLYSLLLVRALALSQTQNLHPLELKEVRYIWGDYHGVDLDKTWEIAEGQALGAFNSVPKTLPFSFNSNVLLPLHMLENMGVNILTESSRYDTWVFNTLYAKIRGTASAQQGIDGRPEIGAVHPLWCLANHNCAPNVSWEWQGNMRFWARKELVMWAGCDPNRKPGIGKGDEVFGHYCDISLPVKERREWAAGALGGHCLCLRCIEESAAERGHNRIV